jgi:hypothetical protein
MKSKQKDITEYIDDDSIMMPLINESVDLLLTEEVMKFCFLCLSSGLGNI